MPDTEVAITELLEIDPDRVDAVSSPANGTDWLILKAIDDSETVATTDEVLAEIAEVTKTDDRAKCDACDGIVKSDDVCKKCFGSGVLPRLGETPEEFIAAVKASAPSGAPVPVRTDCPTCVNGYLPDDKVCPDCDGSGKDSTEPPSDKLNRVDADGHKIHEGDAKGREKIDKSAELCDDDDCDICKELFGDEFTVEKAKLKAKTRNALPDSAFALPGRRYPIHDISHARNALSRVAQNGTPEEKAKVRAAVHRKYPEIESATAKADGTTFSAPNPALATSDSTVATDANAPGSSTWEAQDAQTATDAAVALMAAAELIRTFASREAQEVAAGEGSDVVDVFDASQALCAVNDALGVMARLAFHEGLEAAKSADDVEKAGKRLSRKSVSALATARDHITQLLGDDDPSKNDDNDDGATKSVELDMDKLSKEIENMEVDELTKWADARDEKLVGTVGEIVAEALKGKAAMDEAAAVSNAKNARNKNRKKNPKAETDALEDEADQGTNDSASSPATGAAKSEGDEDAAADEGTGADETDDAAKAADEVELTPEEIEAKKARKDAKKALKAAKLAERELATKVALTKSIEESLAKVVEQNEVLKATVETLTGELDGVKKMAAPSTISRTAPADAQIAAKARDDRDMQILALERKARESNDPDVKKAAREDLRELRGAGVAS